jgi:gliding motility-associated-like protein
MIVRKNNFGPLFIGFLVLYNFQLLSQINNLISPISKNVSMNTGASRLMEDRKLWKEDDAKRTSYSSTYIKPDGKIVIEYSKLPINYLNSNHKLVPIDLNPTINSEGDYQANNQICPVTIKRNGSVVIKVNQNSEIIYSNNVKINGFSSKAVSISQDTTHLILTNILPGIDKVFDLKLSSAKYNYILKSPISSLTTDLIIEEEIKLPQGSKINFDSEYGSQGKNGWEGELVLTSSDNTEIGKIYSAYCFDAIGNRCLAAYKLENINGVQKLKIIIPQLWLNNSSRVYPITIDPLVTGPTSTYSGPKIPSCISPAYGSDSILVTIPPMVTVTGFFVSGSFDAEIFGGANKTHGSMVFRTKCGKSGAYTVLLAAPGATLAGTAYLANEDLKSPLLCCIPQSCATQTLYLSTRISRTYTLGVAGCNILYIDHNPLSGYPLKAYVEGHSAESGLLTGSWKASPLSMCSNVCNVNGTIYIKYGVPPYTITHPWTTSTYTAGVANGCSTGLTIKSFSLIIPGCPTYCTTSGTLTVPPPVVIDACGNSVGSGLLSATVAIIPTPTVSATPNPVIACSDIPFSVSLNSCIPTSTISWSGNGLSGVNNLIIDTISNNTGAVISTTYIVSASNNGCVSNPVNLIVNTDPKPTANFLANPDPVVIKQPIAFTDQSVIIGSVVNNWLWSVSSNSFSTVQNSSTTFDIPGTYNVCLSIETGNGCRDTVCKDITVIPAEIVLPNVITPNGDHINDVLFINYLEFFASNNLKIFDRWGKLAFEKDNYNNTWAGDKVPDGTYFVILTVMDKTYSGFLQVFRK